MRLSAYNLFGHSGIWGVLEQGKNKTSRVQRLVWKFPFYMQFLIFFGGQHVAYRVPILCQISSASFEPTQIHHVPLSSPWKVEVGVLFLEGLSLLRFLANLIVEEILVEFSSTQKRCPHHVLIQPTWKWVRRCCCSHCCY